MYPTQSDYPPSLAASVGQQHDSASTNVQMTMSQAVQGVQDCSPMSQTHFMIERSFYYIPDNDFQVYHITCKESSIEIVFHHLSNYESYAQSNNSHIFYYQHPNDKKIYQVICDIVPYTYIICLLNKINYGIELNFNEQQQQENLDFSKEFKENLEIHLKRDLIYYLPNEQLNMNFSRQDDLIDDGIGGSDTTLVYTSSQQHMTQMTDNNNNFNQLNDDDDYNNTNIYQP